MINMKPRKTYWVKQTGRKTGYWYIQCPDTDLPRGNTTKLLTQCEICDNYKGKIEDEDIGTLVKCGYDKPNPALIQGKHVTLDDIPFYINTKLMQALVYFQIDIDQVKTLSQLKKTAKKQFHEKVYDYHPDHTTLPETKSKPMFRKCIRMYKMIQDLKFLPNGRYHTIDEIV